MTKENKESLLKIYQNFLDEAETLENEIHDNKLIIEEANNYLTNMDKKISSDYDVFSPRSFARKQQDDIIQKKELIKKIENSNTFLKGRLDKIHYYLKGLESVINDNSEENINVITESVINKEEELYKQNHDVNEIIDKLQQVPLQNMNYLLHKAGIIKKYMETKPEKVKNEMETLSDQIEETIDSIKSIINEIKIMMFK